MVPERNFQRRRRLLQFGLTVSSDLRRNILGNSLPARNPVCDSAIEHNFESRHAGRRQRRTPISEFGSAHTPPFSQVEHGFMIEGRTRGGLQLDGPRAILTGTQKVVA